MSEYAGDCLCYVLEYIDDRREKRARARRCTMRMCNKICPVRARSVPFYPVCLSACRLCVVFAYCMFVLKFIFLFLFFYHRFEIPKFNSGWYAMQCYAIFNVLCCCCCCAARTTMSFCLECVLWVRLQTLLTARICSNMLSIFRMHCIYAYRPIYAMSALVERGPSASQIRMPGVPLFNFSITTSMISIWLHAVGH